MARVRELDATGDLLYEAGRQRVIEGIDAEAQAIRVGLSTIRGESLFHPDLGIDMSTVQAGSDDAAVRSGLASAARRTGRISAVVGIERLEPMGKDRRNAFALRVRTKQDREVSLEFDVGGA